jgi:O-antigen/teichoic acid export membrane protein
MVYTRLDVLVLGSFLDVATVGYYGVAFRMTEPFQLMTAALAISMYSHLSATIATNRQNIRRVVVRYGLGTLSYGLASCLLLAVFAPMAIHRFLPKYGPAIPVLQLLAVAIIFRSLNACLTSVVHAYGRFAWVTAVATWNLLAIGALLWILIPRLGAPGAAMALLIGEVMNTLIQSVMVRRLVSGQLETRALGTNPSL